MDSDKSEEEHNAISKQILDYYRKYSQNRDLPKYFRGTSLSYMPPIVKEDELMANPPPIIVIGDVNHGSLLEKRPDEPETEHKAVSPTSSITSTRKLEWDSGADIGYNNCDKKLKLHKSISLPLLTGSGSNKNIDKTSPVKLISEIVNVISYTSPVDIVVSQKQVSSSSSTSSPYQAEVPVESSSSSYKSDKKPVYSSSSSGSIAYLKSKIGSPDAESTPKLDLEIQKMYMETPFAPRVMKGTKNNVVNLCVTKPIVVDCLDKTKKKVSDKKSQTSFKEVSSKSVQTGDSLVGKKLSQKPIENQSVIIINHDNDTDRKTCSSHTQSDPDASSCNSFQYYRNESTARRVSAKSDETDSSKDIPLLGQLITEKQSKSLIHDVDRSINLLQKLLKSKKYDSATKKRYIKKIVAKIVDNKYNEDSTTSSELFVPKKQTSEIPRPVSKFTVKTCSEEYLPGAPSIGDQNTSSGSYQSWKEDKTLSEQVLEQRQKGQGDQLVNFAVKERQHQIAWINDEISHLSRLKGLLEKRKTTTVYVVSSKDQSTENSTSSSQGRRNYIIETELSGSCEDVPTDFNLHDTSGEKNYQVKEAGDGSGNGRVVGDIEVISDDKTTNIKVKTRKVAADINAIGKYDTFPKSKAEEGKAWSADLKRPSTNGKEITKRSSVDVPLKSAKVTPTPCICGSNHNPIKNNILINHPVTRNTESTHPKPCFCKLADPKTLDNNFPKIHDSEKPSCLCNIDNISNLLQRSNLSEQDKRNFLEALGARRPSGSICTESVPSPKEPSNTNPKDQKPEEPLKVTVDTMVQTDQGNRNNKEVQTSLCSKSPPASDHTESSRSSVFPTSGSETTTSGSVKPCLCCKRKNVTSQLKKKSDDEVCSLCRKGNHGSSYYSNPGHVCNCYTVDETVDTDQQSCTCVEAGKRTSSSDYCEYCKSKLKNTYKNRNGIAYMLTLENEILPEEKVRKKQRKKDLEEIKIKIPVSHKKRKDKDNKRKKARQDSKDEETNVSDGKKDPTYSLQEYLSKNRPDFLTLAEDRRRSVHESKTQREEIAPYKKMMFYKKYQEDTDAKRLFSEKEMKDITKRNYRKLPEVQQKLIDNRERQLRQANRLIADTFNRKLRENVLKGKRNLPTDVNVVNL